LSESFKGRLADRVGVSCERLWTAAFDAGGPGALPASLLAPRGGERVLVVAPHPDDEAAGCAGTILAHVEAGDDVTVLVATDGRRSRTFGLSEDEMARRRRGEAEAASAALGASLSWIGLEERAWDDEALSRPLGEAVHAIAPAIVYAPSRVDFHPEHVRVARALSRVLSASAALVRVYQVQVPLARPLVNLVAGVGARAAKVDAILRLYETQWGSLERTLRIRRYAAARHRLGGLAEEFREMPAARYAAWHLVEAADRFRGMRKRAFTDPLSYATGRAARRALAERETRSRP